MPPDVTTLSADAQRRLQDWRITMWELDPRYEDKGLFVLAAIAMADPEYRARLIADPRSVMAELGITVEVGENTTIRFVENTADSLTVILPPAVAEVARPTSVDEYLASRIVKVKAFFQDDANFDPRLRGDEIDRPPGDGTDSRFNFGDPRRD
ncbi:MAG TPA: nitrile hydratase subunit alpha [Actinophytocola sp.]|jgi:hypothetical protein|uniref:nitrile hydratase subunit alpha n=1 Tax=Actinophytocola sp. TaxID=1872138 RepID=UPI002F93C06B